MTSRTCPGLPGNWINGWLAAVGATVLDSRIRLRWTEGGTPVAVLSAHDADPVAALAETWPDRTLLEDLPIARHWGSTPLLPRSVSVDVFAGRARAARNHRFSWTLSSTVTDLIVDKNGRVADAPFNPTAPRGTTLHDRLLSVHKEVQPSAATLTASLAGQAARVQANGLGFDISRLGSLADFPNKWVNPVVEVLAFFGLAILPLRGRGTDARIGSSPTRAAQRGWFSEGHSSRFCWPAWTQRLDVHGIDALMDAWAPNRKRAWPLAGVHAGWRIVPFRARGSSDPTRAFGSERL